MRKVFALSSIENGAKPNNIHGHGYIGLLDVTDPLHPIPLEDLHLFQDLRNKGRLKLCRYSGDVCWQFEEGKWAYYQHLVSRNERHLREILKKWEEGAQFACSIGVPFKSGKNDPARDPFADNCRKGRNTLLEMFNQEIDPAWVVDRYARGSQGHHEHIVEAYRACRML